MKTYQVIKPVFYCFFLALCVFSLKAQQNLVPNGSFEEYSECPAANDLNDGQFERCKGWWSPTLGTPDYFNKCNNNINGVVGVPNNFWGYQEPFEGNGYVGFGTISWNSDNNFLGNEYLRTKLLFPLKPCVSYQISMYVSLTNYSTHGVSKIGACFSKENNFVDTQKPILEIPQFEFSGDPIGDTMNWTKIEGMFIADGGEEYLTIGYFHNDVTNDTVFIHDWGFDFAPYYYIDNVSLYEMNDSIHQPCNVHLEIPNVFTPNNDGTNDIIDLSQYVDFIDRIRILNRWGNTVKIITKDEPIWDGGDCLDGVYYYMVEDEKFKTKQTGFIHLIR